MSSVNDYALKFQQIISYLDWDEDAYITWFKEGLKLDI
jgi:hypothetical protein